MICVEEPIEMIVCNVSWPLTRLPFGLYLDATRRKSAKSYESWIAKTASYIDEALYIEHSFSIASIIRI
jgi:hypothetical protein